MRLLFYLAAAVVINDSLCANANSLYDSYIAFYDSSVQLKLENLAYIEPSVSCFYDSIMRMGRDCDIMLDTWDITRKVSYRHKWICPLFAQLILQ